MPEASCHCGAVTISIETMPLTLTQCTCSVCRRYAALWAFCDTQTATVTAGAGSMLAYIWGDKDIAFQHCSHCGCVTHYDALSTDEPRRLAVNARMLPVEAIGGLQVRTFDGADSWQYID